MLLGDFCTDDFIGSFNLKENAPITFKNDPALIPDSVSSHQQSYFVQLGQCQPSPIELENKMFPKIVEKNGKFRSFHESYYFKTLKNQAPCRRWWLSYSLRRTKFFVFLANYLDYQK